MRQTKTLLLPSALAWLAGLCRLPQAPAGKWPFPALSLQSLHGCLDPYPAAFPRCIYPFLPGEHRPHVRSETFGTPTYSHIATSVGHAFRGCSHSVMFRPPCSLDPQVAPTADAQRPQGDGRTASCPTAPSQIPACGTTAPGSSNLLTYALASVIQKASADYSDTFQ